MTAMEQDGFTPSLSRVRDARLGRRRKQRKEPRETCKKQRLKMLKTSDTSPTAIPNIRYFLVSLKGIFFLFQILTIANAMVHVLIKTYVYLKKKRFLKVLTLVLE